MGAPERIPGPGELVEYVRWNGEAVPAKVLKAAPTSHPLSRHPPPGSIALCAQYPKDRALSFDSVPYSDKDEPCSWHFPAPPPPAPEAA